jgi:hypothetical protein
MKLKKITSLAAAIGALFTRTKAAPAVTEVVRMPLPTPPKDPYFNRAPLPNWVHGPVTEVLLQHSPVSHPQHNQRKVRKDARRRWAAGDRFAFSR